MKVPITRCEYINVNEEEMFSCLQHDDQHVFAKIYDRYSPALHGLILKWVKDIKTAELLLCNAFVKAWQNRKLFNAEIERLFVWLCRLARICYAEHISI